MKNNINETAFPFFVLGLFSCANSIVSGDGHADCHKDKADLYEFQEKNWYLDEVRIGTNIININRNNKPDLTYTIMFNTEQFTGAGAPNRFFGSYAANKDHTILFNKIRSTRMVPIFEMYDIKEHEYFSYIERAASWKVHNGKLELYSSKEDGAQVILVYSNNK
jgi:heat shock protein HslJ